MQQTGKYYQHSGAIPFMGVVYMLVFGGVGAVVLGGIYAYAIRYIPMVLFHMLLVIAYGCCVGVCVQKGAKRGKVRNPGMLAFMGFLAGAAAVYTNWVWWIFAVSKQQVLVIWPRDLWPVIQSINRTGAWSTFGNTPTGAELYVYWGLEALVIVGTSTAIAWVMLSSAPFCEQCERWADEKATISPLEPVDDPKGFTARLEQGDYAPLMALKKLPAEMGPFTELSLMKCPTCQTSNFLTVTAVTVTKDSKGKTNRSHTKVLENLVLNTDAYHAIKTTFQG
jgi:hypothetical protein